MQMRMKLVHSVSGREFFARVLLFGETVCACVQRKREKVFKRLACMRHLCCKPYFTPHVDSDWGELTDNTTCQISVAAWLADWLNQITSWRKFSSVCACVRVCVRAYVCVCGLGNTLSLEQSGITRLLPWQPKNGNFSSNRQDGGEILGIVGMSPRRQWGDDCSSGCFVRWEEEWVDEQVTLRGLLIFCVCVSFFIFYSSELCKDQHSPLLNTWVYCFHAKLLKAWCSGEG